MKDLWIAAIARGHNASVCLMHNGKIVFSIEEERLSRFKYDGGPLAAMIKIKEYTDRIDYLLVAHTTPLAGAPIIEYTGDDVYSGLARKLGLLDRKNFRNASNIIDLSNIHHKLHAACAFYRSGFDKAAALVVDGAGTYITLTRQGYDPFIGFETETIFDCQYPMNFKTVYKHVGARDPVPNEVVKNFPSDFHGEANETHECVITDRAGIVKTYEAVTQYCGFHAIEAGKTMGLFPYGKPNDEIPPLYDDSFSVPVSNRNFLVPNYPANADVNFKLNSFLNEHDSEDVTKLKNRRDLAYAVQKESQDQVVRLIRKAVKDTGHNKVVISGGYGLNCVANYHYLDALKDEGIEIYVEPISNDAGTAIGAAMMFHQTLNPGDTVDWASQGVYLGFEYNYSQTDVEVLAKKYNGTLKDATDDDVAELLANRNIVTCFQGRSENGPRALGNRSILFDPRQKDGKDFINSVKHREYFRPFAGSILEEHAHSWFDLRGMPNSPYMMYAVNCLPGVAEKIPSIIHVDGTCRIQTVSKEDNKHYYDLIKAFYDKTGVPILFNTSFNLGGDPLVETLEDAIDTLARSDIEYLYLPEIQTLVKIPNVGN
jgi:carbamoyltransferase